MQTYMFDFSLQQKMSSSSKMTKFNKRSVVVSKDAKENSPPMIVVGSGCKLTRVLTITSHLEEVPTETLLLHLSHNCGLSFYEKLYNLYDKFMNDENYSYDSEKEEEYEYETEEEESEEEKKEKTKTPKLEEEEEYEYEYEEEEEYSYEYEYEDEEEEQEKQENLDVCLKKQFDTLKKEVGTLKCYIGSVSENVGSIERLWEQLQQEEKKKKEEEEKKRIEEKKKEEEKKKKKEEEEKKKIEEKKKEEEEKKKKEEEERKKRAKEREKKLGVWKPHKGDHVILMEEYKGVSSFMQGVILKIRDNAKEKRHAVQVQFCLKTVWCRLSMLRKVLPWIVDNTEPKRDLEMEQLTCILVKYPNGHVRERIGISYRHFLHFGADNVVVIAPNYDFLSRTQCLNCGWNGANDQ